MGATAPRSDQPATDRDLGSGLRLEVLRVDGMGLRLGYRRAEGVPRGTVVVLPGRAEFIEKYGETLAELVAAGFAVAILDWRGQGGSDRFLDQRYRGHVVQVEDYLADLTAMLGRLGQLRLPRPYVMLAHSMGGHIGLRYLHDHPGQFVAAAMTAPMFGIRLRPTPEPLARAICAAANRFGVGCRYAPGQRDFDLARYDFATNRLTSSPERYAGLTRQLAATPELAVGGVTYGWLGAALRSIALTRRHGYLESVATPILVLLAEADQIVSNRAAVETVRRLPHGRLVAFPGARHELLLERDEIRLRVMSAFFDLVAEVSG